MNINTVPLVILPILLLIVIWRLKLISKVVNFKVKKADEINCVIKKTGQKSTVIKVNRTVKFFKNLKNTKDKTKYNLNIDEHYLDNKGVLTIDYQLGVSDPVKYIPKSHLMLISRDIKNALESKIIQDFKASVTDKLFSLMDLKLTIIVIVIVIIGLLTIVNTAVIIKLYQSADPVLKYVVQEAAKNAAQTS